MTKLRRHPQSCQELHYQPLAPRFFYPCKKSWSSVRAGQHRRCQGTSSLGVELPETSCGQAGFWGHTSHDLSWRKHGGLHDMQVIVISHNTVPNVTVFDRHMLLTYEQLSSHDNHWNLRPTWPPVLSWPLPERRHIIPGISVAELSQPQRASQDNKTSPVRIRTELLSPELIALDLQDDYIDRKQLDCNPYTSLKNSAGIPVSLKHVP